MYRCGMRRAVFALAAIAALGTASAAQERATVAVPNVTSTNLARGVVRLHKAGLHVTIPSSYYLASNSTPQIVRQKPRAGATVRTGTAVELTLAQPPTVAPFATTKRIRVPAVKGLLLLSAVARLERAGVRFWKVDYVPPLGDANVRTLYGAYRVAGQRPAAGTVMRQRRQVNGEERIVPVALSVRTATR
jgi:beta-lactam-binding protein with PASTA domain